MSPEENPEGRKVEDMANRLEIAMTEGQKNPRANGELNDLNSMSELQELRKFRTAIVEFYRRDCPYCERLMPILEELASDYQEKVYFGRINVDDVEDTRERFDVFGVPLVVALKRGMPIARIEGFHEIDVYDQWISIIHSGLRPMDVTSGLETQML
ncbi:MAG: thioredoxin family protein [Candidatus Thorarchaeota archaeon]